MRLLKTFSLIISRRSSFLVNLEKDTQKPLSFIMLLKMQAITITKSITVLQFIRVSTNMPFITSSTTCNRKVFLLRVQQMVTKPATTIFDEVSFHSFFNSWYVITTDIYKKKLQECNTMQHCIHTVKFASEHLMLYNCLTHVKKDNYIKMVRKQVLKKFASYRTIIQQRLFTQTLQGSMPMTLMTFI